MNAPLIRRQPVVNRQKAITASRLIVHADSNADAATALVNLADVWPAARSVFVGFSGAPPDSALLSWQPPENAMIEIPAEGLVLPQVKELVVELTARGVALCLDGYSPQVAMPPDLSFRFLLADADSQPRLANPQGLALAKGLANHAAFAKAIESGYSGAAGWFFLHGMPVTDKLNPSHAQIVRVLNLVRRDADVKEIEAALKQDVTLSYKLLRYINSAGFGLSCEIQSYRHAVTILGTDKLNKWLSMLLVTASRDPAAPALMQTAIARGRLMEIIGEGFVDKSKLDNLFITGAFSLLDTLLGTRLEVVLDQMHLPDAIADALLRREGVYAPFLELALACERDDPADLLARAKALGLPAAKLNHAQIEALAFADSLQFN
jgi:c-di-GMP-related signal transduction protein